MQKTYRREAWLIQTIPSHLYHLYLIASHLYLIASHLYLIASQLYLIASHLYLIASHLYLIASHHSYLYFALYMSYEI